MWNRFEIETPQVGRCFVALCREGTGVRIYRHVRQGVLWHPSGQKGEYEFSEISHMYPLWAYVPEDYKLWYEVEDGGE